MAECHEALASCAGQPMEECFVPRYWKLPACTSSEYKDYQRDVKHGNIHVKPGTRSPPARGPGSLSPPRSRLRCGSCPAGRTPPCRGVCGGGRHRGRQAPRGVRRLVARHRAHVRHGRAERWQCLGGEASSAAPTWHAFPAAAATVYREQSDHAFVHYPIATWFRLYLVLFE